MKFLERLEKKIGWLAIPNLIVYILTGNMMVIVMQAFAGFDLTPTLAFDWELIMQGQIWRLLSFIFIPPATLTGSAMSILIVVLVFMFYLSIGRKTEAAMGSFAFTAYYFFGVFCVIITGILFRIPLTGAYINSTLFLAYAYFYPNDEILLFFILPVKVKYLAYLSGFALFIQLLVGSWINKLLLISGILNFLLFIAPSLVMDIVDRIRHKKRRMDYRKKAEQRWGVEPKVYTNPFASTNYQTKPYSAKPKSDARHCCEVCGRTEISNPELEFRYCSKCGGLHEYCMEHLKEHPHINSGDA